MYFECDCSEEADWQYEDWDEGTAVATKPVTCCECGHTVAIGEIHWWGSGINPENLGDDYYDEGDITEEDEQHREHFVRCSGCHAIAQHLARHGSILGGLAEQVERCTGFDYRDDPATWDPADVDAEDSKHRAEIGGAA